jgi:uncharacterized membrane protein
VIGFLRGLGILNAAAWFGASVFFTFVVGPAFFSDSMGEILRHKYHQGAVAQVVLERYFQFHLVCGLIALAHLVGESLYVGRPLLRWTLSLIAAVFLLGLLGGYGIQPKLQRLHREMYTQTLPEVERETAHRSFRIWHGLSQVLNLVVMAGVTVYLLRAARQGDASRYRL